MLTVTHNKARSIEEQFEFPQARWANDSGRPKMGGGCSRAPTLRDICVAEADTDARDGAIIFRDIVGKLDVLIVECGRCAGPGR